MIEGIPEIGIVDSREIIASIRDVYGVDFDDYALTSFKHLLEKCIHRHKLAYPTHLIHKLKNDPAFFDVFLKDISVPSTEMFRDTSFWKILRDELLPQELKASGSLNILVPACVSGNELFSLCILLKELNALEKCTITATYLSEVSRKEITTGFIQPQHIETSTQNYLKAGGYYSLTNYLKTSGTQQIRDTSLIKQVKMIRQKVNFEELEGEFNWVLFRNKLIYYNPVLEESVVKKIDTLLKQKGILMLGEKEKINPAEIQNRYTQIAANESVYRKKSTA